jgi:hypothetical protein
VQNFQLQAKNKISFKVNGKVDGLMGVNLKDGKDIIVFGKNKCNIECISNHLPNKKTQKDLHEKMKGGN